MSSHQQATSKSTGALSAPGKQVIQRTITQRIFKPNLIIAVTLLLFIAFALFLRVYLPYNQVFTDVGIKFTSNDSYSFMRLVDNLIHNFPRHTAADPYLHYPVYGGRVEINFFVWLITVAAWIIGLGAPSQHTVDVVGVYVPAVLGALTVIPIYFIGKELFNRWAGVLSAGLIAIIPGEYLGRSVLGFTDTNVAETSLTPIAMLFLILAIKAASQRQVTLSHLIHLDWASIKKPLIYSLLAAIFMGIYIFAWLGALLFVFITFVFFVVQFIIDHLKRKSTGYLAFVGVIFFFVTLVMAMSISSSMLYVASLVIATLAMLVLGYLSRLMANKELAPVYYPLTLLGLAGVGAGFLYLVSSSLFGSMLGAFSMFRPTGASLTTVEMQPLISTLYGNRFAIAWGNFNIGFFLSPVALLILIYLIIKHGDAEKSLLAVWSLIILVATLGQRRFGYYLAVNVALLTGYLLWWVISRFSFSELNDRGTATVVRRRRRRRGDSPIFTTYFVIAMKRAIVFLLIFIVFAPNILLPSPKASPAVVVASNTPYAPSDAWVSSLTWLKDNSPEPFGSPDVYYQLQPALVGGASYVYPASAYGVLAWWDYGYWITRIAHRIPNANPSQDPVANKAVASFFTSKNETATAEIRQELNSAYIVIDHETALSKFWAIVTWAGKEPYFDSYLVQQEDKTMRQYILYYPEYYRSMAVRLFNFDGKAVTPSNTYVISYQEQKDKVGNIFKVVTDVKQYPTYQEALDFLSSQQSGNYRIVGISPLTSPVPLEALEHYSLIHSSNSTISLGDGTTIPSVKIFQYVK